MSRLVINLDGTLWLTGIFDGADCLSEFAEQFVGVIGGLFIKKHL